MKPLLVVQNNLVEHLTARLAIAARERGIPIHDLSSRDDMTGVPPFPAGINRPSEMPDRVLVYGSIHFVHQWAAQHPDLQRYVFWSPEAQSAAVWSEKLRHHYHNSDGWETTVGEVLAHEVSPRHYRPMTTTKKIAGSVLTPDELRAKAVEKDIPMDFRLWSSEPKTVTHEVRCFVVDGEIVTYSMYRANGAMHISYEHHLIGKALEEARAVIKRWSPARHFVVDVGLIDNVWGMIEFNPIHSSGWYACDAGVVLDAYFKAE